MSTERRAFFRELAAAAMGVKQAADEAAAPAEPEPPPFDVERYSRQLVLPEWSEAAQRRVAGASVLVVGAGALGSPVALYLAGAGVGRLGIVDPDVVELSNLHRQPLHYTPDVGVPKAHTAAVKLRFLNPDVLIEPYAARFNPAMLEGQDLVVDCTDAFATRREINAACCAAGIPLVEGGATAFDGLVMAIRPGETPCYRCAFPDAPAEDRRCDREGILGPAAGVVGSLMALEALKLLGGLGVAPGLLSLDLRAPSMTRVTVTRDPQCEDCSGVP
jgi:molybdopterin/thiamine biosynthesis adenylyltransferase